MVLLLVLLVCTLDEGITRVPHLLKPEREDVRYARFFSISVTRNFSRLFLMR